MRVPQRCNTSASRGGDFCGSRRDQDQRRVETEIEGAAAFDWIGLGHNDPVTIAELYEKICGVSQAGSPE